MKLDKRTQTRVSKFLSLVLRHEPDRVGIKLSVEGWADVELLVEGGRAHGLPITREMLEEIVATSPKQRFAFSEDRRRIRTSQGHSLAVELGYEPVSPPELLYHGTAVRFLEAIRAEGLKRIQRHHVHLSPDVDTAMVVGSRRGKPVVLRVRAGEMHGQGHTFLVSANRVWLTEHVPPCYIDFGDCED